MELSIQAFSRLAGVSARTLRYYDEIGLFTPLRVNSSGYRIYGDHQLEALRRIALYRSYGMSLEAIARLLNAPDAALREALSSQHAALLAERARLDRMIGSLEQMLLQEEGTSMNREKMIEENEARYGAEIREKYGDDAVNASNKRLKGLSDADIQRMEHLSVQIVERLQNAVRTGVLPGGEEGRSIAALHREWLGFTWPSYTPQAHLGLAQMYVSDPRFTAYYDKEVPGCAAFLLEAVAALTEE